MLDFPTLKKREFLNPPTSAKVLFQIILRDPHMAIRDKNTSKQELGVQCWVSTAVVRKGHESKL